MLFEDFFKFGVKEVIDIILSDNIFVEKEEMVYEIFLVWIEYNLDEWECYFFSLLVCI